MKSVNEIKQLIISETIREIGIDPTKRLEELTEEQIRKEYKTLQMFTIGD